MDKKKANKKRTKREILFLVLKYFLFFFLFFVLFSLFLFVYYARDLPRPEKFTEKEVIQSTKIYDRTGEVLLYNIHGEEKRKIVAFSEIPEILKNAVISAEDDKFYQHYGLDVKGILRAVLVNIKRGELVQGGSTITQQLIRSSFLTQKKTIERKIKEAILSLELERRYSKDQILEWYLNQIPLGSNSYGVGSAAEAYFNKNVSDLSLSESAILAALIQAPSLLSPYRNKKGLLQRRDYVLDRMTTLGYISEEEAKKAKEEKVEFAKTTEPIKAPHFVFFVKGYLEKKYGKEFLKHKGLKVYTTLNWDLQKKSEDIVLSWGEKIKEAYKANNIALVVIDTGSGQILTMIGSKDWTETPYPEECLIEKETKCLFEPDFNVVVQGNRQPGSAFKPFVYATAFEKGFLPETILWDVKTEFNPNCDPEAEQEKDDNEIDCYHPQNYDEKFRGKISLRESLAQSINLPSVKLLYLTGVKNSIKTAQKLGLKTLTDPSRFGLSLVLGGGEVKLLEITSAFGIFGQEGEKTPPFAVLKIEDSEGNIIEENIKDAQKVISTQTANLINDILSDNEARGPMFGYNSPLYFKNHDVAVKTGTTQFFNDAWTIGYTPSVAVGVWVGNNDNSSMKEEPAVKIVGPIWRDIMIETLPLYPLEKFKKPTPPTSISQEKLMLNGKIDKEDPHTILHYIDPNNPMGKEPEDPKQGPQYNLWEKALEFWLKENPIG